MDLSFFLLQGFDVLPKTLVTVNGSSVECVFNQSTHTHNKVDGGYELDDTATIAIATKNLSNPRALKGKIVVIDSLQWRVIAVSYGAVITHLSLIAADKR